MSSFNNQEVDDANELRSIFLDTTTREDTHTSVLQKTNANSKKQLLDNIMLITDVKSIEEIPKPQTGDKKILVFGYGGDKEGLKQDLLAEGYNLVTEEKTSISDLKNNLISAYLNITKPEPDVKVESFDLEAYSTSQRFPSQMGPIGTVGIKPSSNYSTGPVGFIGPYTPENPKDEKRMVKIMALQKRLNRGKIRMEEYNRLLLEAYMFD